MGAVIIRDGLVLSTQRASGPLAGKWEFPGGKVEVGEVPAEALAREIREELRCDIEVGAEVTTTRDDEYGAVELTTFYATLVDGEPELTEHAEARWLASDELDALDWAPADLPAVAIVRARLARNGEPDR